MSNKNYWETTRYTPKTSFDSYLAKAKKREYNQNNIVNKQNMYSAFDNDAISSSALDYLYSSNNRGKTQSFLENNGFPSYEDREYNKEFYGVQEENNRMRDLLKSKTSSILNPKLPDENDRLFLSGFLGDEEEERNYQNEVKNANRAIADLQNAFRGSQFESQINGIANQTSQKINSTPKITHTILRDPNFKIEAKPIGRYDANKEPVVTQLSNKKTKKEGTNFLGAVFPFVSPEFHKKVWTWGADNYLTKKGYHTSAWLLKHSLKENPEDVYRDNNSRIAQLIKNDPAFLKELDKAIAESDGKTLDTTLDKVIFESGDLYYSIHKGNIKVTGRKGNDGKWKISAQLNDEYNFSELTTWMDGEDASLGTLANDAAYFSEDIGAITPYRIYVDFNIER